nr:hypothetical protein [uncultured Flavobacterium sp.]
MIDLHDVKFIPPKDCETFEFKSTNKDKTDVLVIREPFAADYADIKELREKYKDNEHLFYIATTLLLAQTWNGKPGVSPNDVMGLNRACFKEVVSKIIEFQTDIVPDFAKSMIPELLKKSLDAELNNQ